MKAGLLISLVVGSHAQATELDVNAYARSEYTSNAGLDPFDKQEDVIQRVGVDVVLREERKRFNADARFNLEQEFYLNNSFSDETNLTTGIGIFNFDIIEDFLDWRTSFTRTQVLNVASAGDTPDNREERNVFRTGPTVNYRINSTNTVALGVNYVQVENSDDESADTKRFEGTANYVFQYNSLTSFSLNGSYDEIIESDYDDPTISSEGDEIQNITVNVGMNRAFTKGFFGINVGQSQVRADDDRTINGNFFNLQLQREQVLWHTLNMVYSESISDSSIGFDVLVVREEPETQEPVITQESLTALDIIERKRFELSFTREIDTFEYVISGYWNDQNYDLSLNDERSVGAGFDCRQQILESWTVGFGYLYVRQKFLDNPLVSENETETYSLDTRYQWTEDVAFEGGLAFTERTNKTSAFNEYEEFSATVGVNVRLF